MLARLGQTLKPTLDETALVFGHMGEIARWHVFELHALLIDDGSPPQNLFVGFEQKIFRSQFHERWMC